jgi:hypothetical protein
MSSKPCLATKPSKFLGYNPKLVGYRDILEGWKGKYNVIITAKKERKQKRGKKRKGS